MQEKTSDDDENGATTHRAVHETQGSLIVQGALRLMLACGDWTSVSQTTTSRFKCEQIFADNSIHSITSHAIRCLEMVADFVLSASAPKDLLQPGSRLRTLVCNQLLSEGREPST